MCFTNYQFKNDSESDLALNSRWCIAAYSCSTYFVFDLLEWVIINMAPRRVRRQPKKYEDFVPSLKTPCEYTNFFTSSFIDAIRCNVFPPSISEFAFASPLQASLVFKSLFMLVHLHLHPPLTLISKVNTYHTLCRCLLFYEIHWTVATKLT